MEKNTCAVSGKEYASEKAVPLAALHENIQQYVLQNYPGSTRESFVGDDQLINVETQYLNDLLTRELGDLDDLEKEVLTSISKSNILTEKIDDDFEDKLTLGDRIADRVASFGGSWKFIITFFVFIVVWMALNVLWLQNKGFDAYPFILLNLILSCLAALQAPVIMMSQNRVEAKDRIRGEHDYKINLKSELEIQLLHKKIDHLLVHQNKRLLEMQRVQAEMMQVISNNLKKQQN